jgi:hypothetical protein
LFYGGIDVAIDPLRTRAELRDLSQDPSKSGYPRGQSSIWACNEKGRAMTSRLKATERQVLGALIMKKEKGVQDRTVESIAALVGLPEVAVRSTLVELEKLQPPLVHRDTDSALNLEFWLALEAAITAIEGWPTLPTLSSDRFDVAWSVTPEVLKEQLANAFGEKWNDPVTVWQIKCDGTRASFELVHPGSAAAMAQKLERAGFVDIRVVPRNLDPAF